MGDDSLRHVSEVTGIPQATLSRQLSQSSITVETVRKIASAYQVSVIPALIALGVVTESDLVSFATVGALEEATDEQLAEEVLKRMKRGSKLMTAPISMVEKRLSHSAAETDDDAVIDRINSGAEPIAAQERTDPLDEHFT